jgi:hypothetical protein
MNDRENWMICFGKEKQREGGFPAKSVDCGQRVLIVTMKPIIDWQLHVYGV